MLKKEMIRELVKQFAEKQGAKKAKWVYNHLRKLKKSDVWEMYTRLNGNITRWD